LTGLRPLLESSRAEENKPMTKIVNAIWKMKIWKDNQGQDLVEYALMAGFLGAASAFTLPQVAASISNILGTLVAIMAGSGAQTAPGG